MSLGGGLSAGVLGPGRTSHHHLLVCCGQIRKGAVGNELEHLPAWKRDSPSHGRSAGLATEAVQSSVYLPPDLPHRDRSVTAEEREPQTGSSCHTPENLVPGGDGGLNLLLFKLQARAGSLLTQGTGSFLHGGPGGAVRRCPAFAEWPGLQTREGRVARFLKVCLCSRAFATGTASPGTVELLIHPPDLVN